MAGLEFNSWTVVVFNSWKSLVDRIKSMYATLPGFFFFFYFLVYLLRQGTLSLG